MNKRIKELYTNANAWALHNYPPPVNPFEWEDLRSKKFAELIVEECMTMCDTVSADYLKHRKGAFDFQDKNIYAEGEAACDIIKYKMKKHFGVKE
jgi:hypothetical protein